MDSSIYCAAVMAAQVGGSAGVSGGESGVDR
jgi:hypothetical protein